LLAVDLTNFRAMFHNGEDTARDRATRIHNKWLGNIDVNNAFSEFFSAANIKTLASQINEKKISTEVFDSILAELQGALQSAYVKFVSNSLLYLFDSTQVSYRRTMEMRPIILSDDVPPNFSEDALSKCQELMLVFRDYTRSKKSESYFLFYVDVYNYKVRIFMNIEQEKKAARVIAATWLGMGGTNPIKVEVLRIEEYAQKVLAKLNSREHSKDMFQEIFKEVESKLQALYNEFIKTHNIKSLKGGMLSKVRSKIVDLVS